MGDSCFSSALENLGRNLSALNDITSWICSFALRWPPIVSMHHVCARPLLNLGPLAMWKGLMCACKRSWRFVQGWGVTNRAGPPSSSIQFARVCMHLCTCVLLWKFRNALKEIQNNTSTNVSTKFFILQQSEKHSFPLFGRRHFSVVRLAHWHHAQTFHRQSNFKLIFFHHEMLQAWQDKIV